MNIFSGIGNIGKDNDLKYTQGGTAVISNSLAIKRNFKNKTTNEYDTDWINFVVYGKTAENFAKFTHKGSKVGLDGRIQSRSYENQQGQKVYVTELIVNNFHLIEPQNQQGNPFEQQSNQQNEWDKPDWEKLEGKEVEVDPNQLPF